MNVHCASRLKAELGRRHAGCGYRNARAQRHQHGGGRSADYRQALSGLNQATTTDDQLLREIKDTGKTTISSIRRSARKNTHRGSDGPPANRQRNTGAATCCCRRLPLPKLSLIGRSRAWALGCLLILVGVRLRPRAWPAEHLSTLPGSSEELPASPVLAVVQHHAPSPSSERARSSPLPSWSWNMNDSRSLSTSPVVEPPRRSPGERRSPDPARCRPRLGGLYLSADPKPGGRCASSKPRASSWPSARDLQAAKALPFYVKPGESPACQLSLHHTQ